MGGEKERETDGGRNNDKHCLVPDMLKIEPQNKKYSTKKA